MTERYWLRRGRLFGLLDQSEQRLLSKGVWGNAVKVTRASCLLFYWLNTQRTVPTACDNLRASRNVKVSSSLDVKKWLMVSNGWKDVPVVKKKQHNFIHITFCHGARKRRASHKHVKPPVTNLPQTPFPPPLFNYPEPSALLSASNKNQKNNNRKYKNAFNADKIHCALKCCCSSTFPSHIPSSNRSCELCIKI